MVLLEKAEVNGDVWRSVCMRVKVLACVACMVGQWFVVDCGCDVRLSVGAVVEVVGVVVDVKWEREWVGCPMVVDVV